MQVSQLCAGSGNDKGLWTEQNPASMQGLQRFVAM